MTVGQFTLPKEANKKLDDTYKNKQKNPTVLGYWASVRKGSDSQVTEKKNTLRPLVSSWEKGLSLEFKEETYSGR